VFGVTAANISHRDSHQVSVHPTGPLVQFYLCSFRTWPHVFGTCSHWFLLLLFVQEISSGTDEPWLLRWLIHSSCPGGLLSLTRTECNEDLQDTPQSSNQHLSSWLLPQHPLLAWRYILRLISLPRRWALGGQQYLYSFFCNLPPGIFSELNTCTGIKQIHV
jgi:hypothetical protein